MALIKWEPAIYVPGVGVVKLTSEQVRQICADYKANSERPPCLKTRMASARTDIDKD